MTTPIRFPKGPAELLDFKIDYASELAASSDTIQSSLWIVPSNTVDAPGNASVKLADGITVNLSPDTPSPTYAQGGTQKTDTNVTILLSGGTLGNVYTVENRIVTVQGRKHSRTIEIVIEQRYD